MNLWRKWSQLLKMTKNEELVLLLLVLLQIFEEGGPSTAANFQEASIYIHSIVRKIIKKLIITSIQMLETS